MIVIGGIVIVVILFARIAVAEMVIDARFANLAVVNFAEIDGATVADIA
jgi:hypothetical protein